MQTNPVSFRNPFTVRNRAARLLWLFVEATLFRMTPWFLGRWRAFLWSLFGARLGRVRPHGSARCTAPWLLKAGRDVYIDRWVYLYNTFGIELGDRVIISFGSVLCTPTHDYNDPSYPLTGKPIVVEDDVWIAAQAFIAPGVRIGRGSIIGARAVVYKDVPPWSVVAGNPAKVIRQRALAGAAPSPAPAP